jgi:hypothetical protein
MPIGIILAASRERQSRPVCKPSSDRSVELMRLLVTGSAHYRWCYHGGVRFIGLGRSRDRVAIVAALLVPLGVAAVLVPFRTTLPSTVAVLLLVTVVVAVAANGYRGAGWLAAVSAALWFDFFLTRPYERFAITHRADIETTVMLLVVGAAVTELAVRGRWHHHVAQLEAGYLVAIRTTADLVASGASSFQVVSLVKDQLTELLSLRECRFEQGHFGGLPRLEADGDVHLGEVQYGTSNGLASPRRRSKFVPRPTGAPTGGSSSPSTRTVGPASCPDR